MTFFWQILLQYRKFLMPRPLKRGILGASTIFLSKDIYMLLCVVRIFMKQTLRTCNYLLFLKLYLPLSLLRLLEPFHLQFGPF